MSVFFVSPILARSTDYVLFIQSYTAKSSCSTVWTRGIKNELLKIKGEKVEMKTFFLNAKVLSYAEEKAFLYNLLDSIHTNPPVLIITEGDEALFSLLSAGHPDIDDYPLVFMGVQYPDFELMSKHANLCGHTSVPNYLQFVQDIVALFPKVREIICLTEDNILSTKSKELFLKDWNLFSDKHPGYNLLEYNVSQMPITAIVPKLQINKYVENKVVIVPKWTPYTSVLGKSSQCPFFTVAAESVGNGAMAACAPDPDVEAKETGVLIAKILNGEINPRVVGIQQSKYRMMFDYKQLLYFNVSYKDVLKFGKVYNRSFYDKYYIAIFFGGIFLISVTVFLIFILLRSWKKEQKQKRSIILNEHIQDSLYKQQAIYDDMYHSMTECLITYDINYRVNFINKPLKNLLFETDDFVVDGREYNGFDFHRLFYVYNDGSDVLKQLIAKVIDGEKIVELPKNSFLRGVIHRVSVPISGSLFPIFSNGVLSGVCFEFKDSTEEEINKKLLDMAVENSQSISWRYSLNSSLFIFQDGFLESLGFAKGMNKLSKDKVLSLIHPDNLEVVQKEFERLPKTGGCVVTFKAKNSLNEYISYECRCKYIDILLDNTMSFNIVGVLQNVQRFKDVEIDLIRARDAAQKADEIKTRFLANMSHEIRTPLNSIIGFSSILKDMMRDTNEETMEMCKAIEMNGNLLLDIVNDVMDLSMLESESKFFKIEKCDLNAILINYVDVNHQALSPGVELKLELPETKFEIETDRDKLGHVIDNLISNAKKFTKEGQIIVGYRTNVSADKVTIYVEDTGIGIAKDNLAAIFDRFYKVDEFKQGTGLGLTFCQSVLENLNGKISVRSELGKGTRFEVYLSVSFEQ